MKEKKILEWTVLAVVIITAAAFFLGVKNQDINLCRYIFSSLVNNAYPAERFIDWKNLKALDVDVGATYAQLPNEKERTDYKKAFFANFAAGFKQVGGNFKSFTNWRICERDSEKVTVAADYLKYNKTLLFILSKSAKNKLIFLQWR